MSGPGSETKRCLAETDVDPSGDLTTDQSGETEDGGTSGRSHNQPAESRENPARSSDNDGGNRDTENAPKPGHEE